VPLKANHYVVNLGEQPLHYIIEKGEKRLFWGADGAWLCSESWRILKAHAPYQRFVLDGTLGDVTADPRVFEHNDLGMIRKMAAVFREEKMLSPDGQIWLTHLSRDAHVSPRILSEELRSEGFSVATDETEDCF
jgi:hypothetical protein